MDTWVWILISLAAAAALITLAWRSSGHSKPLPRGHDLRLSDSPAEQSSSSRFLDVTRVVLPEHLPGHHDSAGD